MITNCRPTPICGAARPTPPAAAMVSNMSAISACSSGVSNSVTGSAGASRRGSPILRIGRTAMRFPCPEVGRQERTAPLLPCRSAFRADLHFDHAEPGEVGAQGFAAIDEEHAGAAAGGHELPLAQAAGANRDVVGQPMHEAEDVAGRVAANVVHPVFTIGVEDGALLGLVHADQVGAAVAI